MHQLSASYVCFLGVSSRVLCRGVQFVKFTHFASCINCARLVCLCSLALVACRTFCIRIPVYIWPFCLCVFVLLVVFVFMLSIICAILAREPRSWPHVLRFFGASSDNLRYFGARTSVMAAAASCVCAFLVLVQMCFRC